MSVALVMVIIGMVLREVIRRRKKVRVLPIQGIPKQLVPSRRRTNYFTFRASQDDVSNEVPLERNVAYSTSRVPDSQKRDSQEGGSQEGGSQEEDTCNTEATARDRTQPVYEEIVDTGGRGTSEQGYEN